MDEQFKIFRLDLKEAQKIAKSSNKPHFHDYEELIVGIEGQLEHFIDFKVTKFNAPYISFVTKGKLHRVIPTVANGKCDIWVLRFNSEFIPETTFRLYSYYHEHANIELKTDDGFKRMIVICEMMNNEIQQPKPNLSVIRDLLKTLFTMIEAEREKYAVANQTFPKTQNTTFRNFLKILEENFRRPEGVDFYSEKLFMSARNLNLVAQNILQKSISEIIETRKLIEAKNLLIYTDKAISEIGFELGYNEKAYFTSVFKKKSGQTPSEFREYMRKLIS
jgi:AraC family transcriptional regulator, transcriptional activator of pobA